MSLNTELFVVCNSNKVEKRKIIRDLKNIRNVNKNRRIFR